MTLKQGNAKLALEITDLHSQCGLRDVQRTGGFAQAAGLKNANKIAQLSNVHGTPPIHRGHCCRLLTGMLPCRNSVRQRKNANAYPRLFDLSEIRSAQETNTILLSSKVHCRRAIQSDHLVEIFSSSVAAIDSRYENASWCSVCQMTQQRGGLAFSIIPGGF